jgi:hypothetical protein
MMNQYLAERLNAAAVVLTKEGWKDEAMAIVEATSRIDELEAYVRYIILTVDYMPGKMKDKLEKIADGAEAVLYAMEEEDEP